MKSKNEVTASILNCEWPTKCAQPVYLSAFDYEDAIDYYQRLDSADNVLFFTNSEDRFGFMAPALTNEGLLYFLPKLMIWSLCDLESELTSGLIDAICYNLHGDGEKNYFLNYKKITSKQRNTILGYFNYVHTTATKNTGIDIDSLEHCIEKQQESIRTNTGV